MTTDRPPASTLALFAPNSRMIGYLVLAILAGIAIAAVLGFGGRQEQTVKQLRTSAVTAAAILQARTAEALQAPPLQLVMPQAQEAEQAVAPLRLGIVAPGGELRGWTLAQPENGTRKLLTDPILSLSLRSALTDLVDGLVVIDHDGTVLSKSTGLAQQTAQRAAAAAARMAHRNEGSVDVLDLETPGPLQSSQIAVAAVPGTDLAVVALAQTSLPAAIGGSLAATLVAAAPAFIFAALLIFGFHQQDEERRKAVAELQSLATRYRLGLELAGAGLLEWDLETGEVVYSQPWLEMLDLEAERTRGRASGWHDRIVPEDRGRVLEAYRKALDNNEDPPPQRYRLLDLAGSPVLIEERASLHRDAHGAKSFIIFHERVG